ncbi:MAG: hypothetical protein HS100_03675 [Anaerolineales bacterium]|nr:hypothetical protein [Anaerolineales bacterium]
MPDASKTYIVNDQPTDKDALDFTPYVETLANHQIIMNKGYLSSCNKVLYRR